MSYDQLIGDTLAMVNIVRQAYGHDPLSELPDAVRGHAADCLYYRALADVGVESVSGSHMAFNDERTAHMVAALWGTEANGRVVQSPDSFQRVIHAFDDGRLEQYPTGRASH